MSMYSVTSENSDSPARSFELMEMARRSVVQSAAANLNQGIVDSSSLNPTNINNRKNSSRKDRAKLRGRRHSFTLNVDAGNADIAAAQLMAMQQASREINSSTNNSRRDTSATSKAEGGNSNTGAQKDEHSPPKRSVPLTDQQIAAKGSAVEAAMLRAKQLSGVVKTTGKNRKRMRRARRSTMQAISDDGTVDMSAIREAREKMVNEAKERRSSLSSDGIENTTTTATTTEDRSSDNSIDAAAAAAVAAMHGSSNVGIGSSQRNKRSLRKSQTSLAPTSNTNTKTSNDTVKPTRRRTLRRNDSIVAKMSRRMSKVVMPKVRYVFKGDNAKSSGTCVIHAQSSFRVFWDLMLFSLLMYIAFVTPVRIGFEQHPEIFTTWWWFELVIDGTFIVDLFLNFRTTYYTTEGKEVTQGNQIAKNYFSTWFAIDLVSSVPFDIIVGAVLGVDDNSGFDNVGAAKTLKISKSARISKLSKITKVLKLTKLVRLARGSRLISKYVDMFYISRNQMKLVKLGLLTLTIAHFIACGWGLVAHLSDNKFQHTWLTETGMIDESGMEQYLTAFYWSVSTMITVGYGDVHPTNPQERFYAIFAICLGGGFYGYIIASVASLVASWDINRKTYYERMDSVTTYMKVRKFPRPLYRKMRSYFRHFYAKKTSVDEHSILASLSTALRREVISFLVSDIRGKILKGIPMFKNLDGAQLAQLLTILRPLQAEEGQNIVTSGEKGMEMFILMSGQLCVKSAEGQIFAHLDPGACFGELAALGLKEERSATIVATEFCELYSLTRTDIFETFMSHPEVLDTMVLIAAKNLQNYKDEADDDSGDSDDDDDGDDDGDGDGENDDGASSSTSKKKNTSIGTTGSNGSNGSNDSNSSNSSSTTNGGNSPGDSPNSKLNTDSNNAAATGQQVTRTGSPNRNGRAREISPTAAHASTKTTSISSVPTNMLDGSIMSAKAAENLVLLVHKQEAGSSAEFNVPSIGVEEDKEKAERDAKRAMENMARMHNRGHARGSHIMHSSESRTANLGVSTEEGGGVLKTIQDRMDVMSTTMDTKLDAIMNMFDKLTKQVKEKESAK